MGQVNLNIPVLVQNSTIDDKDQYVIESLFLSHPIAFSRRFDQAITLYKKEVRHYFRGFNLDKGNLDEFLWFKFNPSIKFKQIPVSVSIGKQFIQGKFDTAYFELKDKVFVCLPAFDHYFFMLEKEEKVDLKLKTTEVIQKLFRAMRQEAGDSIDPERYYAVKGSFVTTVSLNVSIREGSFKFDIDQFPGIFSTVSEAENFDGMEEIEKVAYDFNSLFPSELKSAYYRESLIENLYNIVYKKENTPVVLIGPDGIGKNTVIHEIVRRFNEKHKDNESGYLENIWHIDPTRIIAGMSYIGWWQRRFEAILTYIRERHKYFLKATPKSDKILFDNPVALLRIGKSSQNSLTLNDVLRPYLEKRLIQVILVSTPEQWKVVQEKDRRFSDLFQVIRMKEPDKATSVKMVLRQRKFLETKYGSEFSIQAIDQLFTIHRNYLKRQALPGSVMRMMNQLAVKYRFQIIDAPEVREEFESSSGLNEKIFDSTLEFEEKEVFNSISSQLIGQKDAVHALTNLIHIVKAKLNNPSKPLGTFLFIGPTGVGKTQAAKVLCKYLLGSESPLMRFDMNEYIDEYAIQRLIGDYNNPEGQLTGKVRYQPFGVILLDEIEKAHRKVHDLLLQVLDDGRLTDSVGRTVDFSNNIIIMTSNIGAQQVGNRLGFETANQQGDGFIYRKAVENYFRPEFVNRIDQIVVFNPLEIDHILNIARLQIKELLQRDGFVRRTTIVNISKDALEWVAQRGFDGKMGGRALKRQIEKDLTVLSAEQLVSNYTDQPIIFDILLEKGKLIPKITPVEFEEEIEEQWLPTLPSESAGKRFYGRLLKKIELVERRIRKKETQKDHDHEEDEMIVIGNGSGDELNWQYYDFKEKLVDIKQQIQTLSLGFRDRFYKEAPAIPLRLKGGTKAQKNLATRYNTGRVVIKDRLFQQEAIKEIRQNYEFASVRFNSLETEYIDNYLNVAFLELFSKGFLQERSDKVLLKFESVINGMGKQQIGFLIEKYTSLFKDLDISFKIDKSKNIISAEGHSLFELMRGEAGLHLFYLSHRNPLPIRITIEMEQSRRKVIPKKVIRIYDGSYTLTDLRSGFTNVVNISPGEFKLLIYAGLNEKVRKRMMSF